MGAPTKTYTLAEVATHKSEKDIWIVVNGLVMDVTEFLVDHPGGKKVILGVAGTDASKQFNMLHDEDVLEEFAEELQIGVVAPNSKM